MKILCDKKRLCSFYPISRACSWILYCEYHSYDFLLNRHFTQSKLSPKNYRDKSKYSNGLIEEINFITFEKYPPMLEYETDKIKEDCIILRWSGKLQYLELHSKGAWRDGFSDRWRRIVAVYISNGTANQWPHLDVGIIKSNYLTLIQVSIYKSV